MFSVCFISLELFNWGKYGGIGKATRDIATGLVKRGVNVTAIVLRGKNQKPVEDLDGIKVYSFPVTSYPLTGQLYKKIDADIYHSQEPSWGTTIAMKQLPHKKHIVTSQNPKNREDWKKTEKHYPLRRRIFNKTIEPRIRKKIQQTDAVYCQSKHITRKTEKLYKLTTTPQILPNPVKIPKNTPIKAGTPTTCFLGRLDTEKNPEKYFQLANLHPDIRFLAVGAAHDTKRDLYLRKEYASISNLDMVGFKSGAEKDNILERSWVLVNTSVSECLPVSFLEAAANRCAILSPHDPDGFSSKFGYHVKDDYSEGLRFLIDNDEWRKKGKQGYDYVSRVHEYEKVIDQHMKVYRELLGL